MVIPHGTVLLQTPGPLPSLAYGRSDLNGWFTVCHVALRFTRRVTATSVRAPVRGILWATSARNERSEEHTSELPSLMRTSSAVFCLNTKTATRQQIYNDYKQSPTSNSTYERVT